MTCIFCKIAIKEAPAEIFYEDKEIIAFNDIFPKAPVHILIVPKKHIPSVDNIEEKDKKLIGSLFLVAKKISREKEIAQKGYRLVFNVGPDAGQTIDHLHLHLMGGKKMPFDY